VSEPLQLGMGGLLKVQTSGGILPHQYDAMVKTGLLSLKRWPVDCKYDDRELNRLDARHAVLLAADVAGVWQCCTEDDISYTF